MKQIPVTDPFMKFDFNDPRHWALTFKHLRCPEHNAGAGFIDGGTYHEPGGIFVKVFLEVCCDDFFNTIIETEKHYLSSKQNVQKLNDWYEQRAENNQSSETIIVDGQEIRDVEIVDLWGGSNGNGGYLELTGKRKIPIPFDEVKRVRAFFYHEQDFTRDNRKVNISGQTIFANEVAEVIYQDETPFVRLTDNRLIEIKPIEVFGIDSVVKRNKKHKQANLSPEESEALQEKI
jgi:hypothetical protein